MPEKVPGTFFSALICIVSGGNIDSDKVRQILAGKVPGTLVAHQQLVPMPDWLRRPVWARLRVPHSVSYLACASWGTAATV